MSIATRLAKGEPIHWSDMAFQDRKLTTRVREDLEQVRRYSAPGSFSHFILNAVKIDCQNVCDYMNAADWSKGFAYRRDLPNVAPPFRSMFFEYRMQDGRKVGVGIQAEELPPGHVHRWTLNWFAVMVDDYNVIRGACKSVWPVRPDGTLETKQSRKIDVEPVTLDWFFPELSEHLKECPSCSRRADGQAIDVSVDDDCFGNEDPAQRVADMLVTLVIPPLMAVSFMHCKNVDLIDHPHRQPPKKKRAKHRKKPRVEWKILVIEPVKKVLDGERGELRGETFAKRLHICRGHFKDYRQSGLFGKYKDVFFWHSHLRGTEADGVVHKSYEVHTPEEVNDEHKRTA